VPYDRNIQPVPQPQPPQPQPIPPYPGFPGPGGAWQPWPEVGEANHFPNDNAPPAEGSAADSTHAADRRDTMSQGQSQSSLTETTSVSSFSSQTPSTSEDQTASPSPREAAARAALNRLGLKPSADASPKAATPTSPDPSSLGSTSTSQNAQGPAAAPTVAQLGSHIRPPKLIPLYGLPPTQSLVPPTTGNHQPGYGNMFGVPTQPYRPTNRLPPPRFGQTVPSNMPTFASQPPHANTTSSRIPPTLTEEQLAGLDVLTRESIDERLRILEGVSGAVYRCIDDLMRLRSALPPLNIPATNAATSTSASTSATAGPSTAPPMNGEPNSTSSIAKEKMKAVPEENAEAGPSNNVDTSE
jgi:E3 ubiquitin-protein ligase synoviolin